MLKITAPNILEVDPTTDQTHMKSALDTHIGTLALRKDISVYITEIFDVPPQKYHTLILKTLKLSHSYITLSYNIPSIKRLHACDIPCTNHNPHSSHHIP